jgi:hypothetical protein
LASSSSRTKAPGVYGRGSGFERLVSLPRDLWTGRPQQKWVGGFDKLAHANAARFRALAELVQHVYLPRSKLKSSISRSRSPSWPTSGLTPIMSACSRPRRTRLRFQPLGENESGAEFRANADAYERFDVDAVGRRGCGIVGLDQLGIERILGAR